MGKVMIISFDGPEETVMDRIYSALVEEGFETTAIEKTSNLSFSEIQIYVKEKKVFAYGTEITLSYHEFFTLSYLAAHPGWVFSKEQIYEAVWKEPGELCGSAVTNVISQIRRKLREGGAEKDHIQTVVHSGYKFVE